jgi:hypothetical protein
MTSVRELADRIKSILDNTDLIKKLAEQDEKDGSVTANLDELEGVLDQLDEVYKK